MSPIRNDATAKLGVTEIAQQFKKLTLLMYDTNVSLDTLREQVFPYLAQDIEFIDPFIRGRGIGKFRNGLLGFHCSFLFDFQISQLNVSMNERGDGGRVIVDGVMNLRELRIYTYPLRTILVYEFVLTQEGRSFEITSQEEMWSFGDMLQNVPLLGGFYDGWRRLSGLAITAFFFLSCALATRLPWARHYAGRSSPRKKRTQPNVRLEGSI